MSYLHFKTEGQLENATRHLNRHPSLQRHVELRRYGRRSISQTFHLRGGRERRELRLESVDISPTGVFLAAEEQSFEPGERFEIEFESPATGRTLRVLSRVARVTDRENEQPASGAGFEFVDVTDEQWAELCRFIVEQTRQALLADARE